MARTAMVDLKNLNPQYITDHEGTKTAVVLPIGTFHELLEDIMDLAAVAERREEPTVSHAELLSDLKRDGLIPG
jgi:hypothetical protein